MQNLAYIFCLKKLFFYFSQPHPFRGVVLERIHHRLLSYMSVAWPWNIWGFLVGMSTWHLNENTLCTWFYCKLILHLYIWTEISFALPLMFGNSIEADPLKIFRKEEILRSVNITRYLFCYKAGFFSFLLVGVCREYYVPLSFAIQIWLDKYKYKYNTHIIIVICMLYSCLKE